MAIALRLTLSFKKPTHVRGNKNGESEDSPHFETKVPRAGVEPARVAPLVFETSASTDSAIWASLRVQRYNKKVKSEE